jgi:hypothetical protein
MPTNLLPTASDLTDRDLKKIRINTWGLADDDSRDVRLSIGAVTLFGDGAIYERDGGYRLIRRDEVWARVHEWEASVRIT